MVQPELAQPRPALAAVQPWDGQAVIPVFVTGIQFDVMNGAACGVGPGNAFKGSIESNMVGAATVRSKIWGTRSAPIETRIESCQCLVIGNNREEVIRCRVG